MTDADRCEVFRLFETAIRTRDSLAGRGVSKAAATVTAWSQFKLDRLFTVNQR